MAQWLGSFTLAILVAVSSFAAAQGPQVVYSGQKISINADNIPLGRLLQLWDQATGMRSHVPPELEDQKVSVHLSGLSLNDAARAMFDKLPVGYLFVEGQGIVVTAPASSTAAEAAPVDQNAPQVTDQQSAEEVQEQPVIPPPRQKPAIPTPFGPIPDAGRPFVHLPPVPSEVPPPPFFAPAPSWPTPPGPLNYDLFRPPSIYQSPPLAPQR